LFYKVAKDWVSDIKFSPDGSLIVFGSHDNSIYIYSFPDFKIVHKPLRKHSSFLMNIDFSEDGKSLHSSCGGYDFLFWELGEVPK
jgi:microtubule-associated protein-like 6